MANDKKKRWFQRAVKPKEGEYRFRARRINGYVLKFGMLCVLIGALATLIILLTQYTSHEFSTNSDIIVPVLSDPTYLVPCAVCNIVGIICLIAYYFMVGKQYRPYQHLIGAGRMHHILIAIGIAVLSIVITFVMMGYTYKTANDNRNIVAIVLVVLTAVVNLASVGYEQWAVFRIEQDILRARSGSGDKNDDSSRKDDASSKKKDDSTSPDEPVVDDSRASAQPPKP